MDHKHYDHFLKLKHLTWVLFHYQKGNYLRTTIPGLVTFPVSCRGNSLERIYGQTGAKEDMKIICVYITREVGWHDSHLLSEDTYKFFENIMKKQSSLALQVTGPEKSSTECEMQACTILSKVNELFDNSLRLIL